MRLIKSLLILLALTYNPLFSQTKKAQQMDTFIKNLMNKMTVEEKIGQMNLPGGGDITTGQASSSNTAEKIREGKVGGLFNIKSVVKLRAIQKMAVEESRLKIPLLFGMDVIHGYETEFPIPLALSCSWDMDLIEKTARIAAKEASCNGICWTFSPMVDIARDPRWGRIAEGSGEDPYLGSLIAKAMVKGYQQGDLSKNNTIMACVKHFALYGAVEAGRDYNTTDMSRNRMYNIYFPPYKAAVDAGCGSVMSSFNDINGIPATANKWLLTNVLRNQWGFKGFVVTDYTAINELTNHGLGDLQTVSALALNAGVNMDMIGEGFLTTLKKSLEEGKITMEEINNSCQLILEAKYKLGLFADPYKYCDEERAKTDLLSEENLKVARVAATETFVLLKNENHLLPLKKSGTIALIGPLADSKKNMLGPMAFAADYNGPVSLPHGIKNVAGDNVKILYAKGSNISEDSLFEARVSVSPSEWDSRSTSVILNEALNVAEKADVIVAVVGETSEMSGESSSRSCIGLPKIQRNLLEALLKTGKPVVMVLCTGRPLTIKWEQEHVPAILNVWHAGTEAGNAIADVLFGDAVPGGKLTTTWPQNVGQVPLYYNHKNTGRPLEEGKWFEKYRSNYLDVSNDPLYPFGFGLSYTTFSYSDISLNKSTIKPGETLEATVTVTNTGNYDGSETVQLYIRDMVGSITRPVKELKGFKKIFLKKGESREVKFDLSSDDLRFYNNDLKHVYEPGAFKLFIGGNSRDVKEIDFSLTE